MEIPDYNLERKHKAMEEIAIITVNIIPHPSIKMKINSLKKEFPGNKKLHEIISFYKESNGLIGDKNVNFLPFLQSSFLACPDDSIFDLSQAFGMKRSENSLELIINISIENAWG